MRIVLTTVKEASVTIEGQIVGSIKRGFCILVGFTDGDNKETLLGGIMWLTLIMRQRHIPSRTVFMTS